MGNGGHTQARVRLHPPIVALWALMAAGLWMLFVWTSNPHEMVVGAGCVLATVVFTLFAMLTARMKFELHLRDLAQGWRVPGYVLKGNWVIVRVLARDLLGIAPAGNLFRTCGFDTGKHDPVRVARTILAVVYSTASPNSIVIGIDQTQSRMLFHQLEPTEITQMARNLGAKA